MGNTDFEILQASGEVLVDGRPRDISFQRKTGYAQQQDIHLETTTVREALRFSAIMRQPSRVSRKDKLAYVEEVIKLLGMEAYADAIVGVPGDGKPTKEELWRAMAKLYLRIEY